MFKDVEARGAAHERNGGYVGGRSEARAFRAAFALLATAVACSVVVLVAPRPVFPERLPALRLSAARVEAQLAQDRALAARAPRGPDVDRLLALYREEGKAELVPSSDLTRANELRAEVKRAAGALFARLGPERTRALIAVTVEAALAALRRGDQDDDARGLLGNFRSFLVRYGYLDVQGTLVAPEIALRAFYKARFNLICERPLAEDLAPIEIQAYQGWNALHASGLAAERRAAAARAFHEAGGAYSAEALAIWAYQGGSREEARALLRSEYERSGALRLRNMALYALHAP